jgi:hypothetical protein
MPIDSSESFAGRTLAIRLISGLERVLDSKDKAPKSDANR